MNKLVSIVLPVYNGEKYLREAIDSILKQSYREFELIIVNDCSTDSTEKIIQEYMEIDSRIVYCQNKVNSKLPKSLNNGFKLAKGEYWTWTSDDNLLHINMIERLVNYLDLNSDTDLVYTDYNLIDENGTLVETVTADKPNLIYIKNVVNASFMYRSSVAKSVGEYDTTRFLVEDYEYWLRINLHGKINSYHECLYDYRNHGGSLTATRKAEVQKVLKKLRWDYLDKYIEKKFPKDWIYNYFNYLMGFSDNRLERIRLRLTFMRKYPGYVLYFIRNQGKSSFIEKNE